VKQKTLAAAASVSGLGLHTGAESTLTIRPAPEGAGVSFVRVDLASHPSVPALARFATGADRGTTLSQGEAVVHTVEHVLSALHGLGVDNAVLELTASEPPEVDGSALPFVQAIKKAGLVTQDAERKTRILRAPVFLQEGGGRYLAAQPAASLSAAYTLEYGPPHAMTQFASFELTEELYEREIAPARTFCFESEIPKLKEAGLIRGGSLANAVVFGADGRPSTPLRFPNEPARHKLLDLLGDLFLAGGPMTGSFAAAKTGHAANQRLARALSAAAGPDAINPLFPSADPDEIARIAAKLPMETNDLMRILPHRYPFLLVDRIVEFEAGSRAAGIKNVSINEEYFQGHFPGDPVMPGVLILEALAQVGAVLVLTRKENIGKLAYFAAIKEVKFRRPVRPGDQLRLEISGLRLKGRIGMANGVASVEGQVAAEAEVWFGFVERGGKT